MTPEEIRRTIVGVSPDPIYPTSSPAIFRSEWKSAGNGAKFCSLFSVWRGQVIATPAICLAGDAEADILKEAIGRIEGHGKEENPST